MITKLNLIRFLLSVLFISLFNSCSNSDNSYPPAICKLKLRIEDHSGLDKVKGIGYNENSLLGNNTYEIKNGLYSLEVVSPADATEKVSPLQKQVTKDYECLYLTTTIFEAKGVSLRGIGYTLICPYVFGDNEKHTILSQWEKSESNGGLICTQVTVDGKDFAVEEDHYENYSFISKIKID